MRTVLKSRREGEEGDEEYDNSTGIATHMDTTTVHVSHTNGEHHEETEEETNGGVRAMISGKTSLICGMIALLTSSVFVNLFSW